MAGGLAATRPSSGNVNFLREGLCLSSSLLLSLLGPQFPHLKTGTILTQYLLNGMLVRIVEILSRKKHSISDNQNNKM